MLITHSMVVEGITDVLIIQPSSFAKTSINVVKYDSRRQEVVEVHVISKHETLAAAFR